MVAFIETARKVLVLVIVTNNIGNCFGPSHCTGDGGCKSHDMQNLLKKAIFLWGRMFTRFSVSEDYQKSIQVKSLTGQHEHRRDNTNAADTCGSQTDNRNTETLMHTSTS